MKLFIFLLCLTGISAFSPLSDPRPPPPSIPGIPNWVAIKENYGQLVNIFLNTKGEVISIMDRQNIPKEQQGEIIYELNSRENEASGAFSSLEKHISYQVLNIQTWRSFDIFFQDLAERRSSAVIFLAGKIGGTTNLKAAVEQVFVQYSSNYQQISYSMDRLLISSRPQN